MLIMLVDDAEPIRAVQKKILRELGDVQFLEASDGAEALRLFNTSGPIDLALIDFDMPQINGIELSKRIRQFDTRTPLIMCTAEAGRERVIESIRAGVNNYLIKPFTPESLLGRVRDTLARQGRAA